MPNIASTIRNYNKKVIMTTNCKKPDKSCNCRNKENCPMKGGKYRKNNLIYEATDKKHQYLYRFNLKLDEKQNSRPKHYHQLQTG